MSVNERIGHALGHALLTALTLLGGILGASVTTALFGSGGDALNASIGFAWGSCLSIYLLHLTLEHLRLKIIED